MNMRNIYCLLRILLFCVLAAECSARSPLRVWVFGDNTGGYSESQMLKVRALYDQLEPADCGLASCPL